MKFVTGFINSSMILRRVQVVPIHIARTIGNKQVDADAAPEPSESKEKVADLIKFTTLDMLSPSSITSAQPASSKAKPRHPTRSAAGTPGSSYGTWLSAG